ncbi:hypothetical protein DB31_4863 [Hyalangium minutum]|uniref:Uncharacterized protein n=1 Tax=Hyalangium minutum TaxID=394096 RepID=A0A085VZ18_9BACT|nr:hypothetical protein DB31_6709 [Hyalangium minutum]KFE60681.1 hypothetical protein DB31_4863 [Hyalangium minutum]
MSLPDGGAPCIGGRVSLREASRGPVCLCCSPSCSLGARARRQACAWSGPLPMPPWPPPGRRAHVRHAGAPHRLREWRLPPLHRPAGDGRHLDGSDHRGCARVLPEHRCLEPDHHPGPGWDDLRPVWRQRTAGPAREQRVDGRWGLRCRLPPPR